MPAKRPLWLACIYPVFAGLLPALLLMLANITEADWSLVALPLIASAAVAILLLALALLVLRDRHRAGAVTLLSVLLIFSYGHVAALLVNAFPTLSMRSANRGVLIVYAVAAAGVFLWVARRRPNLERFSKAAGLIVTLLLISTVAQLLWLCPPGGLAQAIISDKTSYTKNRPVAQRPDIYWIILDGYARNDVLQEVYGYDNSAFTGELTKRGFFVAERSYSSYPMTFISLASSLNMAYVNEYTVGAHSRAPIFNLLRDHKVGRTLQGRGYTYIHFNSGYGGTDHSSIADIQFPELLPEFQDVFVRTTIFHPPLTSLQKRLGIGTLKNSADSLRYYFTKLREIPGDKRPTFTFAHIVCPHAPYYFKKDGSLLSEPAHGWEKRAPYLAQLEFANRETLKSVDAILKLRDKFEPPVIIIQSDHGSASLISEEKAPPYSHRAIWERMGILNACFGPKEFTERLRPNTAPVNTFRVLFASLFGAQEEELRNRHYFSWYDRPFDFIEASDILSDVEAARGRK